MRPKSYIDIQYIIVGLSIKMGIWCYTQQSSSICDIYKSGCIDYIAYEASTGRLALQSIKYVYIIEPTSNTQALLYMSYQPPHNKQTSTQRGMALWAPDARIYDIILKTVKPIPNT